MSIYIDNKKLLSLPDLAGGGVNLFRNTYDFATFKLKQLLTCGDIMLQKHHFTAHKL